jgi:carbon storage regulator
VLVVTRKRNEAIIIGDAIEVRVLRIGREGVRLGVTAPSVVPVHRTEIYKLICEENRAAAGGATVPGDLAARIRSRALDPVAASGKP